MLNTNYTSTDHFLPEGETEGHTEYYDKEGYFHRLDGPAIEDDNPNSDMRYWYFHGKQIECSSQEEFERYLKLKAFW
jgi:hypothetical protein